MNPDSPTLSLERDVLLFFGSRDRDTFVRGDRRIRRIVRERTMRLRSLLQPGKQQLTGYDVSFALLCRALRSVGMNVHVDDYALARKNPDFPVSVSGYPEILHDWQLPNPALLGPGLYEHPKRNPSLMADERFRAYFVKSEWMRAMFEPYYGTGVVKTFFSGIDPDQWRDQRATPKAFDFLIYDKIRWHRDRYVPELLAPVLRELTKRGFTHTVLQYGKYEHKRYARALAQCRSMIFLCEHETQGMAWQEALACGVPVLAWDQGFWLDPGRAQWEDRPVPASSVPGFSERCGERFARIEEFPETLDRFSSRLDDYTPREWVQAELSLARSAAVFLDAYRSVGRSGPGGATTLETPRTRSMPIGSEHPLRLLFVADGDPRDPRTNSGVASRLLRALSQSVEIVGALSSQVPKLTKYFEGVKTFAPDRKNWRSRWRLSMGHVRAAAAATQKSFETREARDFDALFQIGTYCKTSDFVRAPVFVYIDHDLAAQIELDPRMRGTSFESAYVRERLGHEREVLHSCAHVFTFSEWCRNRVIAKYGIAASHVRCVGAGSNLEHVPAQEPQYAARHAVFVGLDFERKGGPTILTAFERVRKRLPDARLTIVGGLPAGEPAPGVYSSGPLRGPDSKAAIADILASASVYVMPSVFEPFGIALLEAMAHGLACIGSNVCAMPEIIGDCGATVSPGNVDELEAALFTYLSDPELCREKGRAAKNRYEREYGWSRTADKIRATIETYVGLGVGGATVMSDTVQGLERS